MADTEKPALPPTPTRIQLAKDIAAGKIRRYGWIKPWTHRSYDDRDVTAWVKRFVDATLAEYGEPNDHDYSIVSLTPAGEEWLAQHGKDN